MLYISALKQNKRLDKTLNFIFLETKDCIFSIIISRGSTAKLILLKILQIK